MPGGRPTTYDKKFIDKIDEYLELCKDEWEDWTKSSASGNVDSETFERYLTVRLPSREGFSEFIEIPLSTMKGWYSHKEFSDALEKIDIAQHNKLLNQGLAGNYNSTIAKLILSSNHGYKETKNMQNDGGKFDNNIKLTIVDGSSDSETV